METIQTSISELSIRNTIIFSTWDNIKILLENLNNTESLSYDELKEKCKDKLKGGTYSACIKDCKVMGLIGNGGKVYLKDLGKELLNNFSFETKRKVALNVPLFNLCYQIFPQKAPEREIKQWFSEKIKGYYAFLGSVITRYMESVYSSDEKIIVSNSNKNIKEISIEEEQKKILEHWKALLLLKQITLDELINKYRGNELIKKYLINKYKNDNDILVLLFKKEFQS